MCGSAETGRRGEQIAADWLRDNGFEIVERGWRSGHLEVDIIARRNGTLHFVEVKCRRNRASAGEDFAPEFAMNAVKKQRLMAALDNYVCENEFAGEISLDLIAVNLSGAESSVRFYQGIQW